MRMHHPAPREPLSAKLMTGARLALVMIASGIIIPIGGAHAGETLPHGMVYLKQIDPTIAQDMRYAGSHNFLGRPVAGYEAGECIVSARTANALAKIQSKLKSRKLSLKVYDCYRPMRAVRDFITWAREKNDRLRKREFYPGIAKGDLFKRRYISKNSKHTLGNTVDLTLIHLGSTTPRFDLSAPQLRCDGPRGRRSADNSLDFGTGYDCFHTRSGRGLEKSYRRARANRKMLNSVMAAQGFRGYSREWWHFKLPGAGAKKAMDFPVRAMPAP